MALNGVGPDVIEPNGVCAAVGAPKGVGAGCGAPNKVELDVLLTTDVTGWGAPNGFGGVRLELPKGSAPD